MAVMDVKREKVKKSFYPLIPKGPASEVGQQLWRFSTLTMQGVNAEAGWQSRQQRAALCRNNHKVTISRYVFNSQRRQQSDGTETHCGAKKGELGGRRGD